MRFPFPSPFPRAAWRAILLALGLVLALPPVSAQELRLGFVNTQRILRDAEPAKAAQRKIEAEFGKRDKELQDMAARLKSLSERLERDAAVTSESERTRRQREFAELEKDFQRKQREFREDLNQRQNEEVQQLIDRANRIIRQIAEQEKFDLIVQDAVYWNPRIDVTDKVLRALATAK
ncbi:MAG: OmpH family outer membrane protein [Betaproteobacteria bacterium]|nr:OmpH family outer membrane protein [Betaproteobacteria bacterium]